MVLSVQNRPLVARAYWLIRLRWLAILGVIAAAAIAGRIFNVPVRLREISWVVAALTLYNLAFFLAAKSIEKTDNDKSRRIAKFLINIQIALDMVTLTTLLYYSGGIENPFVLYFVFHMVIASILLSIKESYLHATFAILVFGLMVLLEHNGIIPHHCLKTQGNGHLQADDLYIFGSLFAFGTTLYLVVYMTNFITIRLRQQEQAYREANIQLKQKDRVKDEYVARVTHDIKGHLAAIQSCLGVLADNLVGTMNERQSEFVDRAHNRTKKLSLFVKTLLKLTQMRLSERFEEEVFTLSDPVCSAIESVRPRAIDKSINLSSNIQATTGRISGNQFSIEEMVTNLLLNAIKYTPTNGNVQINLTDRGDKLLIEIADTGIGIPTGEIDSVFDEFFRATNAKESEPDGTGLGLSIVKQIVERHGGTIWVESTQGRGSTFKLLLPTVAEPPSIAATPPDNTTASDDRNTATEVPGSDLPTPD